MKKTCRIVLLILIVLLTVSCRRDDISINQILSQPYIKANGEMGLSVYLRTSLSEPEKSSLLITDPSGKLTWTVSMNSVDYQGTKYYGTSDISMPLGSLLPTGLWNLDLIYKDGRTVSETFTVNYKNAQTILETYSSVSEATFDAESNLTIIP